VTLAQPAERKGVAGLGHLADELELPPAGHLRNQLDLHSFGFSVCIR